MRRLLQRLKNLTPFVVLQQRRVLRRGTETGRKRPTHADWPLILDGETRLANGHETGRAEVDLQAALKICGLDDGRQLRDWYRQHDAPAFARLMPDWPEGKP